MKTIRWQHGQVFVGAHAAPNRENLDQQAQNLADAYVQWEPHALTLHNGARVASGYVLWSPEQLLAQQSTDGVAPSDTPPSAEPPALDLKRHNARDLQIDDQTPASAELSSPPRRRPRNAAPPRQKTTKHKGVTRIDRNAGHQPDGRRITATHGYMVRVLWKKTRHQAFFSDLKYGDRLAALDAAVAWRDRTEKRIGKPRTDRTVIGYANSNTGELGISRRIVAGHPVFEVAWRDASGKTRRTKYSIDKNGEKPALRKAKKARRLGELRRVQEPPER